MEAGQAKVVAALFQRYCHQLLAAGQLEHAFRVAATLSSRAALDDVYVVAIQRSEANVAEAVYAAIAALPAGPGCPLPPRVADLLRLQRLEQEAAQGLRPNGKSPEASQEECVAAGIALEARGRIHEALALYSEHRMVEAQQQLSNLMQAAQVA
ncbi:hypothetical protein WJX72_005010 [[Myrmecia] bisecta]|uniref:Uncharacterized protein n=1 Tax=[Myrmecia] bisecta TaxID=41462 RepID=A0AAW1Q970_9CHLO